MGILLSCIYLFIKYVLHIYGVCGQYITIRVGTVETKVATYFPPQFAFCIVLTGACVTPTSVPPTPKVKRIQTTMTTIDITCY